MAYSLSLRGGLLLTPITVVLTQYLLFSTATAKANLRVNLKGHVPHWATEEAFVGDVEPAKPLRLLFNIAASGKAALSAVQLATKISDPKSPRYRKYLTIEQYTRIYAPSKAYTAKVEAWLAGEGFDVIHVPVNRKYVEFSGTAAQVEASFDTKLAYYSVGFRTKPVLYAPSKEPSIPRHLTGGISGVTLVGLAEHAMATPRRPQALGEGVSAAMAHRKVHERGLKYVVPRAPDPGCTWSSDGTTPDSPLFSVSPSSTVARCNYSPAQLRSVYGVPSNATGKNQTIAFVLWNYYPFAQDDLDAFSGLHGLKSTDITQVFPPYNVTSRSALLSNPPPANFYNAGSGPEIALDLQSAHGMAPDANLTYIYAASPYDVDLIPALNGAIVFGLASIISNSWGEPLYGVNGLIEKNSNNVSAISPIVDVYNELFVTATILGIGVLACTLDGGDFSYTPFTDFYQGPSFPACSPWVTAVGATFLAADKNSRRLYEIPWGYKRCFETFGYEYGDNGNVYTGDVIKQCVYTGEGGGGGIAANFYTSYYQNRVKAVKSIIASTGFSFGRVIPDISAVGDPSTGLVIVYTSFVNGTTGSIARSFQRYGGTSLSTPLIAGILACVQERTVAAGQPKFGFIAPTLYSLPSSAFYDVLQRNYSVLAFPASENHGLGDEYYVYGENPNLPALAGFDNATGLGTPSSSFYSLLCAAY